MANTSAYPITVDGVRLDTLAWGVEMKKVTVPGVRGADEVVPGVDGVIPAVWEDYEPALYSLDMMVRGSNEDGLIPADSVGRLRENLDLLLSLFSKRHGLIQVTERVDASGTVRSALMKRVDSIVPEIEPGLSARFTVTLMIPGVYWRGSPVDWVGAAGNFAVQDVTTLQGSTAQVQDGIFLVKGPITNPTITDPATGWSVRLNGAVGATETWRVNSATWSTRKGVGLTVSSADSAGADMTATTEATAPSGRFIALTPVGANRNVQVRLTGSGTSSATQLTIRAGKAYL